jgi:transketolase C-terminal domain/subunit
LDEDMLAGILARYRRIVTVEEHVRVGGLGGLVCEVVLGRGLPITHVLRLGIDDCYPTVVGDQRYLRAEYELSASAIANAVDNILD